MSTLQESLGRGWDRWWFRGQPHILGDSLLPGVLRPRRYPSIVQVGDHDERFLADACRARARSRYSRCPALDDFPGWLFLMHRQGLPTRLLAWSASPLVALFFAVEERRSAMPADCEVVAIQPRLLNLFEHGHPDPEVLRDLEQGRLDPDKAPWITIDPWGNDEEVADLFKGPFSSGSAFGDTSSRTSPSGPILALRPIELDVRVCAQQTRFTIHGRASPLDGHPMAKQMLRRVGITSGNREPILYQLQQLGVSRMTLFNDLGNLSVDLSRFGKFIEQK